ncbi:MAG TPA: DUF2061 domain-containing protein [Methylocystis sp.]
MSRAKAIVSRQAEAPPAGLAWPSRDFVAGAATVGAVVAGAALLEAALIPGVAIGAAAVLTPGGLPWLRRNLAPLLKPAKRRPALVVKPATPAPLGFPIRQALAKTITYRIIVTALDFTWNYVVIGEVAAAAGLSAITLAVAPVFYFVHEAAWEYSGAKAKRAAGADIGSPAATAPLVGLGGYSVNRALTKTITFRSFATTTDFATNYAVVRDLPQAAMLTAFGFVVGPFVYLGHEMAWDRFGTAGKHATTPARLPPGAPKGVEQGA